MNLVPLLVFAGTLSVIVGAQQPSRYNFNNGATHAASI
jgi:hypothetical protein